MKQENSAGIVNEWPNIKTKMGVLYIKMEFNSEDLLRAFEIINVVINYLNIKR